MSDKAHKQTDKKLAAMEKHVREIYSQAEGDMRAKWQEFMENAEKRTEKLRERYNNALKDNDPKEIQEAKAALQQRMEYVTFRNEQYRQMVEQMAANYEHANEIALAYINGELPEVYALNYNYIGKDIESKIGGYSFTLVDQNTVMLLATQDKSLLPTKKVNVPKDMRWNTKQINAQVMQGILQGESMYKIAARLQNVTDMTSAAAIRNARTMVTGAENAGRMHGAENAIKKGVLMKKCWLATRDERTRDWHTELNGMEVENDEPFENSVGKIMYPGDPHADPANVYNCRCTLTYKVVGFKKPNGETVYIEGNSGLTEQGESDIIKRISDVTGINEENIMISNLPQEAQQSICGAIERSYNKFPQLREHTNYIGYREKYAENVPAASASCEGRLYAGKAYLNFEKLSKEYDYAVRLKEHPKGTTANSIFTHEIGHQIDGLLTNHKIYGGDPGLGVRTSKQVQDEVLSRLGLDLKEIRKEYYNKGYRGDKLNHAVAYERREFITEHISEYAAGADTAVDSYKEFFAECYSEYMESPEPREAALIFGEILEELMEKLK